MADTLKAMARIAEIKARREAAFYRARMLKAKGGVAVRKEADRLTVHKNRHLKAALGAQRERNQAESQRREEHRIKAKAKKSASALQRGQGQAM